MDIERAMEGKEASEAEYVALGQSFKLSHDKKGKGKGSMAIPHRGKIKKTIFASVFQSGAPLPNDPKRS
ncbi:hypothetical protein E8P77_35335 [Soehngenia saccharolytica]|nr:hypothetical protein E8P77_35335 [Soehngenia saccharolytica]